MNQVILIGRLTRDPELRYVASTGKAVGNFTLAVNRIYAKKDDEVRADFFKVTVWGAQAENVANYLKKGSQCAVTGSIQINKYTDKDGNQRYSTDIQADRVEFLTPGGGAQSAPEDNPYGEDFDHSGFPMVDDDDVPF